MALIIVIVITFDISEKLDDFLSGHASLQEIVFDYYLNFIPGFVNLYSPLFIFISVIFFTSKLASNTEIIAILGSGISYKRLLRPYLYGATIVALIVLIFGNFVIPISNRSLEAFDNKYIHIHKPKYFSNLHFQAEPGVQIYAESYDSRSLRVNNFHRDTYDKDLRLRERESCSRIVFDTVSGLWSCENYVCRTIDGRKERITREESVLRDLGVCPEDFNSSSANITSMNTIDLYRHIVRERMRGSTAVIAAKIELYQRLVNPLSIFIMTLIGAGVSSRKSRGGIGMHLAIGISLAFGYIVFMKVTTVFAIFGTLSPFLSVLLPQIVFGIAAAYMIKTAPK